MVRTNSVICILLSVLFYSCTDQSVSENNQTQYQGEVNRTPPDVDAHHGDMSIDPSAISQTARLGDRSFSPYANRKFPTRPLWGDQHIHSGRDLPS